MKTKISLDRAPGYLIKILSRIPKKFWMTGRYSNYAINKGDSKCCVYGHLAEMFGKDIRYSNNTNTKLLDTLSEKYGISFIKINDGEDKRFRQIHPKDRVLAALKWIKTQKANY